MADFTDIAIYLSSGRVLAWVGAGPSVELGLPTWRELANAVLEECRRRRNRRFNRIETLYREGKYLEQFDEVSLAYGKEFLHAICEENVRDPGRIGEAYRELSRLDFLSYFTTNYDNILYRHLDQAGKIVRVFRNSREELEAVDVDTTPSLVKLHGDFVDSESVILTKSDYRNMYRSGQNEGFQTFLNACLARDRILFVGYSLNDPEILQIQERLATNFTRNVSPIAIIPNATDEDVDSWKRHYNIDVVPYSAAGGDHQALVAMLKSLADVISDGNFVPERRAVQDLRKAQALYMWHRFSPSSAGEAPVDALQSIVMASIANAGGEVTVEDLATSIRDNVGAEIGADSTDLKHAINQLTDPGWVLCEEDAVKLMPEGRRIIGRYEQQFESMIDVFNRQLARDLREAFDIEDVVAQRFSQVVLDALIDLFEIRGQNILEMLFDATPIDPHSITDILQTLWSRANTLEDPKARASLVGFLLNMLANPTGIYESVLNYLSKAFFCIQAMRVDPAVPNLVSEVVADRTLLIDENVLIPLTAKHEERNEFVFEAVHAAVSGGMSLCTTQRFVDSVRRHSNWALELVDKYGTQSEEVMRAAGGEGGYTQNAFLKGFVNQNPDDHNRDFMEYLRECFGGDYSRDSFDAFFENELGIRVLDVSQMAEFAQSKDDQRAEAARLMDEWNQSRPEDNRKSLVRIESEVEALLIVSNWDDARSAVTELVGSRVSFITSGSSVARLVRSVEIDSSPMMVASPEAVWELIARLVPAQNPIPSFRSMMLASHFKMAEHFVNTDNYRRFFRPLIADARREFEESRDFFEETLSTEFAADYLDEMEQEEWPRVVSGLRSAVSRQETERGQQSLLEEIERLRGMVGEYEEQERRRRDFRNRQRRQQQQRGQRRQRQRRNR